MNSTLFTSAQLEYGSIKCKYEEAFLLAFEQLKAFAGSSTGENAIDYLLGAYSLFPRLQAIPEGYWLAPCNWRLKTLPKTSRAASTQARFYSCNN